MERTSAGFPITGPRVDGGWAGAPVGWVGVELRGGSRAARSCAGDGLSAGDGSAKSAAGSVNTMVSPAGPGFVEAADALRVRCCTACARLGRPPVAARTASASSAGFTGRSARASRACAASTAGSALGLGIATSDVPAAEVAVDAVDAGLVAAARADPVAAFLPGS